MLLNLLSDVVTSWWPDGDQISWLKPEWTWWLWWVVIALAALFLLMIVVLFFKAIVRTRERKVARQVARERAEITKEQRKAEKEAEKARKQAEKEAEKARKQAEREEKLRQKEEKKRNRVEETAVSEQPAATQAPIVVLAGATDKKEEPEAKREMISLTCNADFVRRDFYVGDSLTYEGLIVNAHFNREPFKEQVSGFSVVAPDMSREGNPTVVVMYQDRATSYTINVRENPSAKAQEQAQPQQQVIVQAQPQVQQQPVAQPAQQTYAPEIVYVQDPQAAYGRTLMGISLDLGIVQRQFTKGEQFNCEGLVVYAEYNSRPTKESIVDYTLIDEHAFRRLQKLDKVRGVYVIKPHLHSVGIKVVTVGYKDLTIAYTVSVMPPVKQEKEKESVQVIGVPVVQPAQQPVAQPAAEPAAAAAEQPKPVRELTNLTLDTVVVQRDFTVGDEFNCDGLLVNAAFNMAPMMETYAEYSVVDMKSFNQLMNSDVAGVYVCEPDLSSVGKRVVRVCLNKRIALYIINVHDAKEPEPQPEPEQQAAPEPVVVERVVEKVVEVPAPQPEPVVVEKIVEKVVEVPVEKVVEVPSQTTTQVVETVVIGEESYEAGKLRYDKSFEARLIQSDDEIKHWYTEIKNELLSYKTCRSRISWKRETFKAKKDVVAKLVYRGNTLCLFLPLDLKEYADNKDIEDASKMPVYEDTPALLRLKNEKRVRLAKELIGQVMTERGILHGAHKSEDFYVPYEGILELINRGLIKREIKTVEDEAIFERDKEEE